MKRIHPERSPRLSGHWYYKEKLDADHYCDLKGEKAKTKLNAYVFTGNKGIFSGFGFFLHVKEAQQMRSYYQT